MKKDMTNMRISKKSHNFIIEQKYMNDFKNISDTIEKLCLFFDELLSLDRIKFDFIICKNVDEDTEMVSLTKLFLNSLKNIKEKYKFKFYIE